MGKQSAIAWTLALSALAIVAITLGCTLSNRSNGSGKTVTEASSSLQATSAGGTSGTNSNNSTAGQDLVPHDDHHDDGMMGQHGPWNESDGMGQHGPWNESDGMMGHGPWNESDDGMMGHGPWNESDGSMMGHGGPWNESYYHQDGNGTMSGPPYDGMDGHRFQGGHDGPGGGPGYDGPPLDFGNATLVNNTCPVVTDEPTCYSDQFMSQTGIWVCRSFYDPMINLTDVFSFCSDPEVALDTDICGCCDGQCPAACTCTCDLFAYGDGLGVLVQFTGMHHLNETDMKMPLKCLNATFAYSVIGHDPGASCVTGCGTR